MTWNTSEGERVLTGAEAELFLSGVSDIVNMGDLGVGDMDGISYSYAGRGVFSQLSNAQRYTVLEEVTKALLTETDTCPELTHVNEACIYYVFTFLKEQLEVMVDMAGDMDYGDDICGEGSTGSIVMKAFDECFPPVTPRFTKPALPSRQTYKRACKKEPPVVDYQDDEDCTYLEESRPNPQSSFKVWKGAVDMLSERILWDHDFDFDLKFSLEPEANAMLMIEPGYFALRKGDIVASKSNAKFLKWVNAR